MEKLSKLSEYKLTLIYALRDLSRNYKKISSIILTLFISLFILSSIFTIEDSLNKELNNNSRALLGGDIEIDYNRNVGNLELINQVKEFATVSQMVEFSTMISTTNQSKNKSIFSRIKTVDQNYPLFGKVGYEPSGAFEKLQTIENTILVNENIFKNLNLKINDKIKVQDQLFTVIGIVKSVPDIGGAFVFGDFALAGKQTLEILKLNNLGSFLNYEYKVRFNEGDNPKALSKQIEQLFKDEKKVKLRYHEKSDGPLKRIIDNFSQFLSLVSISAMLIAGIGIANTLLSFINQNNMSIAVKKSLGFFSKDIKIVYYLQLLILLFLISTAAYSFSFFLVPIVDVYLSAGLGLNIEGSFSILNYFKVFLVGLLVLIIFSIPTINAIDQVKASNLFRNVFQNLQFYYSKKSILLSLLLLSILISLFTIGSARPVYSLGYFGAFFVCLLVFYLLSNLIIKLFKGLKEHPNISIKVSVKNITQTKSITPITIMSLGLGVTLLLTLAFVGSNFKREIAKSIPELAPDYFFIGIQSDERQIFEDLIIPIVQKTMECCARAMKDAQLNISDINTVLMVGGSTRVPFVKQKVADFFAQPVNDSVNPDEVVALGAAVQADILAGNNSSMLLLDITPLSLGIETMGGLMDVLLPRNAKIPTQASRQYTTQKDAQTGINISVYQGERDLVKDNRQLGAFTLKGIPSMPAGLPKVEVRFLINADGILQVSAKELRSGVSQTIDIKPQNGLTDEEVEQRLLESITHAKADISMRALVEARTEAEQMLDVTEKFLVKNAALLTQEELTKTAQAMQSLQLAITMEDKNLIQTKTEELNDISRPFAERVMDQAISGAMKGKNIEDKDL